MHFVRIPMLVWLVLAVLPGGCRREPTPPETSPVSPSLTHSVVPRTDPTRADLEAKGRFVYERHCLVCHGRWGDGRGEMAAGMLPRPQSFSRGRFKFRSTPSGFLPTDDDLRRIITQGVAGSSMPMFAHLSDQEVNAVIVYLKFFSRRWDDPQQQAEPLSLPPAPSWLQDPAERGPHEERGRHLFALNCAACHGAGGRGDGPAAARLEDDAGRPAPPTDFTVGLWKSGPLPSDLFRTLATGLDGTPMPSFIEALSDEDRWELVSFLMTLPGSVSAGIEAPPVEVLRKLPSATDAAPPIRPEEFP